METTLSLPGISLMYAFICFIGLIVTYNILPETENRTLEDIELHFSDNSRPITNREITMAKHAVKTKQSEADNLEKTFTVSIVNGNGKSVENSTGFDNKAFESEKV